jgi:oligoribonuclease
MDLEMTGLEPAHNVIVEIATIITDDELNIVAEGPDLVVHQPEEALALMEQIVVEMHTKSGLLDQIRASTITLEEAGAADARVHQAARARGTQGAAVRQLHRDGPPLPRRLPARDREPPALPQRRREQREGARAPLVPGRCSTGSVQKAGSHRALDDIRESVPSCSSTASTSSYRLVQSSRQSLAVADPSDAG